MSDPTFARRLIDTANYFYRLAGLRLLSNAEYENLKTQPTIDSLRLQSRQTAIAGTLTAFAGYLSTRNPENAKSASIYELAGYLQHPHTIADQVLTTAAKHDGPLDRFMSYYADHFNESNSQWSQDIFVSFTLNRHSGGKFLEMGGADGITHSNTLSLEDCLHWSGTLIEPHPEQYRVLSMTRGRHSNRLMNCAATPSTSAESLTLIDAGQLSSLSTYSGNDLHHEGRNRSQRSHTVTALPFQDIMDAVGEIDYLSLDVEGPELALMNSINWKRLLPPKVVTVEHNWRQDVISGIRETLGKAGYIEAFRDLDWLRRGDLWFFHSNTRTEL
jgi:hypothetical protein